MSDFKVGNGGSKDKYMVGWNKSASNASAYKVGNSKAGPSQSGKSVGGDQDSVVGGKSGFNYSEPSLKDPGDKSVNMNFGGSISNGPAQSGKSGAGGLAVMEYTEKGDWDVKTDAMARRKANMDASSQYYSANGEFKSPTVDLVNVKK